MCKNEKYFLNSLRYAPCHAALSLHSVSIGSLNKGYAVRVSARPSPKFFFRFAPEKLCIIRRCSSEISLPVCSQILRKITRSISAQRSIDTILTVFCQYLQILLLPVFYHQSRTSGGLPPVSKVHG